MTKAALKNTSNLSKDKAVAKKTSSPFSTSSKTSKKAAIYKPVNIWENVGYTPKENSDFNDLSNPEKKAFNLINKYYLIDDSFETNNRFGPSGGITFHQRVFSAYQSGLLDQHGCTRDEYKGKTISIYLECGSEGHKRNDCEE